MQSFTINPGQTFPFIRGFLIGIAIVTIITQFLILDKISILLMIIPLIPILVFIKRDYGESFALTISKNIF